MTTDSLIAPARKGYLNTALTGIPAPAAVEAARSILDSWGSGTLDWPSAVDELDCARQAFAELIGMPKAHIGVGHTVAATLGGIASNLPDNAVVLAPEGEHNSNIYPYLEQARRGVKLEFVPIERLAEAVRPHHAAVAFSLVQSADGRIADLTAIAERAHRVGTMTLVDVTQGCGWLRFDPQLCDVAISASYKWLMSPNGPAFVSVSERGLDHLHAGHRSWIGNVDVHAAPYGLGGQAASDARRFDVVPNFIAIAAATRSIMTLAAIGIDRIEQHNLKLVSKFCAALDLPPHESAIVSMDAEGIDLSSGAVVATARAGRVRFSFHLYNDETDVEAAVDLVQGARRSGVTR